MRIQFRMYHGEARATPAPSATMADRAITAWPGLGFARPDAGLSDRTRASRARGRIRNAALSLIESAPPMPMASQTRWRESSVVHHRPKACTAIAV